MIGTEHLLLSILKNEDSVACSILNKYGVIYENVKDELESMKDDAITPRSEFPGGAEEEGGGGEESYSSQRKSDPKSKTPVLDNFGRDLT
ncbi:MAG: Clp protease N-terminal domain-containing protein, partial [Flavobacteriales bacterium]|nr:Clp protease N-terminal domain-containing protein [Flavobacteriales bacterium]